MQIRPYSDADWARVREIYDLSKPDEMRGSVNLNAILPLDGDPSMLALFRDSVILVADEEDRVIGFGGHKGNYISWLFVHPSHRRKGVARALLNQMIRPLTGSITLNVAATNHAARRLYAGLGFKVAREFAGKFNGHDVDVMTLTYEKAS